jgi:hypothetical protein
MNWLQKTNELLGESILEENIKTYYHGTSTVDGKPFDKFIKSKGARTSISGVNEVEVDWSFFTEDKELAMKFARAKQDYYDDQGKKTKPIVIEVNIDLSNMKVLDLSNDEYEDELARIDSKIAPYNYYGIGNYFQTQMWEWLEDKYTSDIIINNGVNVVKLLEPNQDGGYSDNADEVHSSIGNSIAVHHSVLDKVIIKN